MQDWAMAKHGRKMAQVHLSEDAREALNRIHAIWDAKSDAPSITNGAAVAIALKIWADVLDPETDSSVYSDEKLMELLRTRCFMTTCEGVAKVIEASELFAGTSWALSGDPKTETITVTVGDKANQACSACRAVRQSSDFYSHKPRSLGELP